MCWRPAGAEPAGITPDRRWSCAAAESCRRPAAGTGGDVAAEGQGVKMPRVVISDQRRRWGNSDRSGTIRLNWRIIQAPMRLVDYVVVHELVHLRHRAHGRRYWRALGRVMPDYARRREDLRQRGVELAWQ